CMISRSVASRFLCCSASYCTGDSVLYGRRPPPSRRRPQACLAAAAQVVVNSRRAVRGREAMLKSTIRFSSALGVAGLAGCLFALPAAAQQASAFVPVTDAMLQDPAPGDWLMWRRTLDGWGY